MPLHLGTSTAVLDNVIFCHQEDSFWPIAESSDLKKRFDSIFEAQKYTKAIENIKVLQKGQKENLIKHKKDEEHTKVIKGKAEQNKRRTKDVYNQIEELRTASEEMGVKIREATRKAQDAWEQGETAGMIVSQLHGKRVEEKAKEESISSVKETLTEMTDSDESLQQLLDQYEERMQTYDDDLQHQKTRYRELATAEKETRRQVGVKERECGLYEAQQARYEQHVEEREKLVKETARSHNIRGFDMEVTDGQVRDFIDRITKMAKDQNAAFERARRETQAELQVAQQSLNQINESKSALNQRKQSARQAIDSNDRKLVSLQGDLNKINIDEGTKSVMEANLRESEIRLNAAKSDTGSADWQSNIGHAETELRRSEDQMEKLQAEVAECTRQASETARLDFMRKELKDRQRSLETMTGAHGEKVASVVGKGWTPATIEADYQRAVEQSNMHFAEAEKQRNGISHEMEQVEFKLSTCRADLKGKRAALAAAEKAIRDAVDCEASEYPSELQEREQGRDIAKSDAEGATQLLKYFDTCFDQAQKNNGCRTCARTFKNQQELNHMVELVKKERKRFENADVKKDLEDAEQVLAEARAVSSEFDTWERLSAKEIPAKGKEEQELTAKRQKLVEQVEQQDGVVADRQTAKREVDGISKTIQNIAKYDSEIRSFETQIKDLAAKQNATGLSRGIEVVQEEQKKLNETIRAIKARLAKATGDRDRSTVLINKLELEYRDIKSKLSTAEYELKQKQSLEAQMEDYKTLSNEQRGSIKTIDQDLQNLVPQLSQAQAKYDDIAQRGADKDRELQSETNKINSSLSDLKKADQEVKTYLEKGGPEQLRHSKREVEDQKNEGVRLEQEISRQIKVVKELEDQFRNHSETRRSIADNQRYRRDLKHLHQVRAEIQELETHNAEEDKARYEAEGNSWQFERNKHAGAQATMVGQMKTLDNQLNELMTDYKTDYENASKKYLEAQIMVQTTKACVEDLGRYSTALDQAIMKYHSLKMEEINGIIAELWTNTYQGSDVDTIMIRSETEGGANKKSHNYRVIMVKQDAEMDMRGRCSAGQKVLACIIIRLALAECFGTQCGVLALDEPTTNLDRENIASLARSLNAIIKNRRHQPNFQLIVITHDEDFLRDMQCSEFAENYFRVSRNSRQKSTIERQAISLVM